MNKNIFITIESIIILGLAVFIYTTSLQHKEIKVIQFPEIKLGDDERIIGAEMKFETTHIKSVRNIPPSWYANIDLDVPPNPVFKGSIINGAAALGSSKELPEFEVENVTTDSEPIAIKAIFDITKYPPGNPEEGRRIEIEMNKP
jgi:hypothetical protein